MVYIDGQMVDKNEVWPLKHKFIGMFRSPQPPYEGASNIVCPCGDILQTRKETFSHWQMGHFDVPQYESMEIPEPPGEG